MKICSEKEPWKMPLGCNVGCLAPSFRKASPLRAGFIFSLMGGKRQRP
ncbi:MAG: hypothetical protein MUC50_18390 [Myxococcota bacterium]|nr:hypothetical protein [Myxococcota bacterium]